MSGSSKDTPDGTISLSSISTLITSCSSHRSWANSMMTEDDDGEAASISMDRDNETPMEGETGGALLLPLKSIFDCSYISSIAGEGGKSGWECGWCGLKFFPKHASRALRHVLKIKRRSVEIRSSMNTQLQDGHCALCRKFVKMSESG